MHTTKNHDRPTFTYDGQPVRAAGILIYVTENGRKYYLLRCDKKRKWGDIGGKTDMCDTDILATIVRETVEETNNHLFSPHHTFSQAYELLDNTLRNEELEIFYCPRAKYVLVKVHFDSNMKNLSMKRFGLKETTAECSHYYSWVSDVVRHKLHPRLRCHTEYDSIFKLYN